MVRMRREVMLARSGRLEDSWSMRLVQAIWPAKKTKSWRNEDEDDDDGGVWSAQPERTGARCKSIKQAAVDGTAPLYEPVAHADDGLDVVEVRRAWLATMRPSMTAVREYQNRT